MNAISNRILIIDKQDYWRKFSKRVLEQAGFFVIDTDNYACGDKNSIIDLDLALVVLGCATIGPEETEVIKRILKYKQKLLVLSTSLPWQAMRSIFLLGAEDVTNKPYESKYLLEIVKNALDDPYHKEIHIRSQTEISR